MRLCALRRLPWRPVAAAPRLPAIQQLGKKLLPPRWPGDRPATLPPCRGICSTWGCLEKQGAAGHGEAEGAAAAAREIIDNSRRALDVLQKEHPALKPTLAVVQVGDDAVGQDVIRTIARKIGLDIVQVCLPHNSTETEITEEIIKLNENPKIHGLLLRLSKPSYTSNILNAVKSEKDVAGVTDFNLARLVHGDMNECVVPPLAGAVVKTLEKLARTVLDGKTVLLLGLQGPLEVSLQCLLQRKGAMTTSCPWKTKHLQTMVFASASNNMESRISLSHTHHH